MQLKVFLKGLDYFPVYVFCILQRKQIPKDGCDWEAFIVVAQMRVFNDTPNLNLILDSIANFECQQFIFHPEVPVFDFARDLGRWFTKDLIFLRFWQLIILLDFSDPIGDFLDHFPIITVTFSFFYVLESYLFG